MFELCSRHVSVEPRRFELFVVCGRRLDRRDLMFDGNLPRRSVRINGMHQLRCRHVLGVVGVLNLCRMWRRPVLFGGVDCMHALRSRKVLHIFCHCVCLVCIRPVFLDRRLSLCRLSRRNDPIEGCFRMRKLCCGQVFGRRRLQQLQLWVLLLSERCNRVLGVRGWKERQLQGPDEMHKLRRGEVLRDHGILFMHELRQRENVARRLVKLSNQSQHGGRWPCERDSDGQERVRGFA